MKPLDRKLLRDLYRLRGQVITIALVVACGIATYASMRGTHQALLRARDRYYEQHRFADVFATLKRAPLALEPRIEDLPGVAAFETRVVETVLVPLEDRLEPATGRIVSLPDRSNPRLNTLYLRTGRLPEPTATDEALVIESFAQANDLTLGDRIPVVLHGTLRHVRIVGIALSPEYVLPMIGSELIPDPGRFAVLWMPRSAVAAAYDMEGAFNDVTLALHPGASKDDVLSALDVLLEPYGGFGAYGRDRQLSNYFLSNELSQLEVQATVMPAIFLGVAAFLLNVVLSRLVQLQRDQIAALKALGYTDREIGLHYLALVSVVVTLGSILGLVVGAWLGSGLSDLYTKWYRFPVLEFTLAPRIAVVGVGVSLASAVVGALSSVRGVMRLPPAEAMRPPAPALYRPTIVDRFGLSRWFGQSSRMVLREIERHPFRLFLSVFGISMAVAIVVLGRFFYDSMDHLIDVHFRTAMREDIQVAFRNPLPERARNELAALPGVTHAESLRIVAVRIRSGPVERESTLQGVDEASRLRRLLDTEGREVRLPPEGVALSRKLGEILGVAVGDTVRIELLEGNRQHYDVRVSSLVDDLFGLQAYMRRDALFAMLGEEPSFSMALLAVSEPDQDEVQRRLRDMPAVASVARREGMIQSFEEQSAEMVLTFTFILTFFAATIAIGVVYNNARIALSLRSRELGSLRVLGFTRGEVAGILLGELAIQVLLAIPLGMLIGTFFAGVIMDRVDPENYRLPAIVSARTYAFAAWIALGSGVLSAILVRRKLDRLDLIGVLKTRE